MTREEFERHGVSDPVLLDPEVVPFLQRIWAAGFQTLQSCWGHGEGERRHTGESGASDGSLWVVGPLSWDQCSYLARVPGVWWVSQVWGRESVPFVEIVFRAKYALAWKEVTALFERWDEERISGSLEGGVHDGES